jgi:hypothetical protein
MILQDTFLDNSWISEFIQEAIIALILGAIAVISRLAIWWVRRQRNQQLKKDLHPYFSAADIRKATRYYVPTQFQSVPPSQYGELIQANTIAARNKLIPFFLRKAFHPQNDHQRFYIVLAGSGMGKTTFMINLYLRYLQYSRFRSRAFHIKLMPLGYPEILKRIEEIPDQPDTILLLDGLDEDSQAVRNYQKRMEQILKRAQDFRVVVFTCRTQFFPSEEDEPRETRVARFGSHQGFQEFAKMYLAPFSARDIKAYLRKKYGPFQRKKKETGWQIVSQSPNLMVRPMILNYIDDLLEGGGSFDFTAQLYEVLISKWIEREADRVAPERRDQFRQELYRFSQEIAINIYKNRTHRKGLYIRQSEIRPFSEKHKIQLEEIEMRSRSLLNRNLEGQYKFAHKSILEYFLAREMTENPGFATSFHFEGMDLARSFYQELLMMQHTLPWFAAHKGQGEARLETGTTRDLASLKAKELMQVQSLTLAELKDCRVVGPLVNLTHLALPGTQIKDIRSLVGLPHLQWLNLNKTKVRKLEALEQLEGLRELRLDHCPVQDLSPIRQIRSLRYLSLAYTEITHLEALYELYELETLVCHHTKIKELAPIRKLRELRHLNLSHTSVQQVNPIRNFEHLQNLNLSYSAVVNLNAIKALKKLRVLSLNYAPVQDLKPLQGLPEMRELKLKKTQVSSLQPLYTCEKLRKVEISREKIDEGEIKAFQQALPGCELVVS